MHILSVGEYYPLPICEGMRANFASTAGNLLQIGLHDISEREIAAFKRGRIKCGIYVAQPVILWIFDFGEGGLYDAPFSAALYSADQLQLFDVDNANIRILIELHVVELNSRTLKTLRNFTISNELTIEFFSAVHDQLSTTFNNELYEQSISKIYQRPIENLAKKIKLHDVGT